VYSNSSAPSNNDIALKKSLIEKKLEESGEKARLEEHLRQKLIECGWKDELKKYCLGKLCASIKRSLSLYFF
jgi:hypothetical protein